MIRPTPARRGATKCGREAEVEVSKCIAVGHRMDEVEGGVDVRQGMSGSNVVTEIDHDGPLTRHGGLFRPVKCENVVITF